MFTWIPSGSRIPSSFSLLRDVLHNVLLRWKSGDSDGITKTLRETGFGMSDVFYRVAQAIAESLSNDDSEKKLLERLYFFRNRFYW